MRDLRKKKKSKPAPKKPEQPKRAHSKAVIIKPAERVSYAAIREIKTKDLLVEVKRI